MSGLLFELVTVSVHFLHISGPKADKCAECKMTSNDRDRGQPSPMVNGTWQDFERERKWKLAQAKKVAFRLSRSKVDCEAKGVKRLKVCLRLK